MRYLVCEPRHFGVEYVINPWMDGNLGRASAARALSQWQHLVELLSARVAVERLEPAAGLPDMPFTANGGLAADGGVFIPSRFLHYQRGPEVARHRDWFAAAGWRVEELRSGGAFEGEGDALFQPGQRLLWAGYGVRSSLETHRDLVDILDVEVVSLRLVDQRFYHLDTCFAPLPGGRVIYFPQAFDNRSIEEIVRRVPAANLYAVGEEDALAFACNAVPAADSVIMNHASTALRARLRDWGLEAVTTPLDEFMKAGGAAKCLCLRLGQEMPPPDAAVRHTSTIAEQLIEIRGHILNTGLLNATMEAIAAAGGSFTVEQFEPGIRSDMTSTARVRVCAATPASLDQISWQLLDMGAIRVDDADAVTAPAPADGIVPDDFYSTTIHPTEVRLGGGWVRASHQRMDCVLVVGHGGSARASTVACSLMRDVRAGDAVVVGSRGIRIHSRRERPQGDDFGFMSSGVSTERRVEIAVEQVAWDMRRVRDRGGRIVVVAGPVVVHTGGGPCLEKLIRAGHVQALLAGNALAVHDLENALFGTSLGVDLRLGRAVTHGHRHHLKAINLVRRCGSIRAAIEQGHVRTGIMHACVCCGVPFSLAGSIRDDGPLPETVMDLVHAQREYARLLEGADMVFMLASMLHAIGVSNMTPAGVRLVCVDINPSVVTKLADRGSLESVGIVTDVGLFLNLLVARLLGPGVSAPSATR